MVPLFFFQLQLLWRSDKAKHACSWSVRKTVFSSHFLRVRFLKQHSWKKGDKGTLLCTRLFPLGDKVSPYSLIVWHIFSADGRIRLKTLASPKIVEKYFYDLGTICPPRVLHPLFYIGMGNKKHTGAYQEKRRTTMAKPIDGSSMALILIAPPPRQPLCAGFVEGTYKGFYSIL